MEPRHSEAELKMFAVRAKHNHASMIAFAGTVAGLGLLCIIFQLVQRVNKGAIPRPVRMIRAVLDWKAPGLPSYGHALVLCLYGAINIIIAFTNIDNHYSTRTANLASRFGWLAMANLAVVVLLALKNIPLALLGPYSYERLNVFHQVVGSLTIICVVIHASLFAKYFVSDGRASFLLRPPDIMGMVAGLSFLMMGVSGVIVRRWWYELFYCMHVTFWITAVVTLGFHQPEMGEKIVLITLTVGSVWTLERLIRLIKLLSFGANNEARLVPLSNGATRVTLKKAPKGAIAGKHCYLWIPRVRMWQTHPFTMSSTGPVTFVVKSRGGFTAELYKYALVSPGAVVKASVEGPYGSSPDATRYKKIVFIAGGSGASFTFGTALAMLTKLGESEGKTIVFIWVVKEYCMSLNLAPFSDFRKYEDELTYLAYLQWYPEQVKVLLSDSRVRVHLFITSPVRVFPADTVTGDETEAESPKAISEKTGNTISSLHIQRSYGHSDTDSSLDGTTVADFACQRGGTITHSRPNVGQLIKEETQSMEKTDKMLVMSCGPQEMMADVRKGVAEMARGDRGGVELYCEQFGW